MLCVVAQLIDVTGETFGSFTVLSRAPSREGRAYWLCQCVCGKQLAVNATNLRRGLTKSCGCQQNVTHGNSHNPDSLYRTWTAMKQRVLNPNSNSFHNYGGRGITIHPEWIASYATYEADVLGALGPRPPRHTLDRIDNDGNYEPGNLRWATKAEQQRNRRTARQECAFEGCSRMSSAGGLCQSHARQRKAGQPLRPIRPKAPNGHGRSRRPRS